MKKGFILACLNRFGNEVYFQQELNREVSLTSDRLSAWFTVDYETAVDVEKYLNSKTSGQFSVKSYVHPGTETPEAYHDGEDS